MSAMARSVRSIEEPSQRKPKAQRCRSNSHTDNQTHDHPRGKPVHMNSRVVREAVAGALKQTHVNNHRRGEPVRVNSKVARDAVAGALKQTHTDNQTHGHRRGEPVRMNSRVAREAVAGALKQHSRDGQHNKSQKAEVVHAHVSEHGDLRSLIKG
jgi:hypothetical protein